MPDSSTGGYLNPTSTPPTTDKAFDRILQGIVKAISGLPGTNVVPRWYTDNGSEFGPSDNWCSIGTMRIRPDGMPIIQHSPGSTTLIRFEVVTVLASFYGPQGSQFAGITR